MQWLTMLSSSGAGRKNNSLALAEARKVGARKKRGDVDDRLLQRL